LFEVFRKLDVISGHFTLSLSVHGSFILLQVLNLRVELFHLLLRGCVHLVKFISLLFGFSQGFMSYKELLLHLLETLLEALDLILIFSLIDLLRLFFLHFGLGLRLNLFSFLRLLFCLMGGLLFSSKLFLIRFHSLRLFFFAIILNHVYLLRLFGSLSFLLRFILCFLARRRRSGLAILVDIQASHLLGSVASFSPGAHVLFSLRSLNFTSSPCRAQASLSTNHFRFRG